MTDLLIVVCMVLMLGLVIIPALADQAKEAENRVKCAGNLRQIWEAMQLYANEETRTEIYPRTRYDVTTAANPKFYTKPRAQITYSADGPEANDVTAALYRAAATQKISMDAFVCPSTGATPSRDKPRPDSSSRFSNFESQANLSYSMQNPYGSAEGILSGFAFTANSEPERILVADMNPGTPELLTTKHDADAAAIRKINSPNHGFDGQNVVYRDGHVAWHTTPFVGPFAGTFERKYRDNIYATLDRSEMKGVPAAAATIVGPSATGQDVVLLPVWDKTIPYPKVESIPDFNPKTAASAVSRMQPTTTTTGPATQSTTSPTLPTSIR